jgi:Cupin
MDALSDVLRAVRLTGAVFFDVHASEPWVAEAPPGRAIVGQIFPGAEHLIPYHVVMSGTCWGHVVGDAPRQLLPGDVIVFPHGDPHVMSSTPGMRGTPRIELYRPPSDGHLPFTLTMGSERPEPARIVCGFLGCDARPFNPLLSALPHVLVVNERAGGTLNELVRLAVAESKQPRMGGQCVLGHLSEVMFVDVVRRHLESLPLSRRTGSRLCAIPSWAARLPRSMPRRRATGRSKRWPARWACHAPRSPSGSPPSSASRRCSTWRAGACSWPPRIS